MYRLSNQTGWRQFSKKNICMCNNSRMEKCGRLLRDCPLRQYVTRFCECISRLLLCSLILCYVHVYMCDVSFRHVGIWILIYIQLLSDFQNSFFFFMTFFNIFHVLTWFRIFSQNKHISVNGSGNKGCGR